MMPRSPAALFVLLLVALWTQPGVSAEEAVGQVSRDDVAFFESHIRPLLVERCFKCHGEDKQKGGLRLDRLNAILSGGETGPAVVPGKPDESLLVEAIRYESFEMPPSGRLPDEEIGLLTQWVAMGAPWPEKDRDVPPPTTGQITDEDRAFWAYQPLRVVDPPQIADPAWSENSIDRFVRSQLDAHGLHPAPPADRVTLCRRLYQDLVGLPPTPDQLDAFLSDERADAVERLVDELLASPRYGEHWATFWLDLVRYAESDGYRADGYRPHAWRYRDYVIRAFNEDKPYDRFVMEQLAGDELAPDDPQALAATGYLRHGIYEYNQRDAETQWQDMLNEITDTTGDAFLGLGMGCARCHDHKFDAILQQDYFRLQAFFAGIAFRDDVPVASPQEIAAHREQRANWESETADLRRQLNALEQPRLEALAQAAIMMFPPETQAIMQKPHAERTAHERQIAYLVDLQVLDRQQQLASKFKEAEKEEWESLKQQLAKFDHLKPPPLPAGQTVSDIADTAAVVYIPGRERLGAVEPGFLSVLDPSPTSIAPLPTSPGTTGRRAALARWLTRPDHPLTTRVIVNRIWQQHFGRGIVATASDFGRLGEPPTHPELLDWLAVSFVENGWSLKWLHRQIVNSQTYRQQAVVVPSPQALQVDPGNRLLWRQNIRRLTAEQIRDATLAVSGQLTLELGGAPEDARKSQRRSVYTKYLRNTRDPLLDVFDLPDRITGTGLRNVTTTPAQSLLLINSEQMLANATAFAERLDQEVPGGDASQWRLGYRLAYGRDADDDELQLLASRLNEIGQSVVPPGRASLAEMPSTGARAVRIVPTDDTSILRAPAEQPLPTENFTVEAIVLLQSPYPDATVRTIVSQWDGNDKHPGWSLGVTSLTSAYQPRNLILQLVGTTAEGGIEYEVVPSNIHLELNTAYYVSVRVEIGQPAEAGVTFVVRRLSAAEEPLQTVQATHRVTGGYTSDRALVIGGRDGSTSHRWDGLIDEVRLSARALEEPELLVNGQQHPANVLGQWTFDDDQHPLADTSGQGQPLIPLSAVPSVAPQLVDFCHVLLNSNEFLYVD